MIREDIAKALSKQMGIKTTEAECYIETILTEIERGLVEDGRVLFRGYFKMEVKHTPAREGRNPNTGEPYPIHARKRISFKASPKLKQAINNGHN